ncbi:uncharacterized protein LOC143861411 [Tasmannia lanceolata]|uniref:uncharacterized protein LOC143861411 n=1 Tax=Tasmannia lanceolata TaxID=3420 RepID=UPI0040648BC9
MNLRENLSRKWKLKGDLQIFFLNNGFYLFQFTCLEDCDSMLESGDHSYAGRPLILRKWKPGTPLEKLNLTSIPVWVRLPGLPLEFWSAKGLSKIARFIGNPLFMDSRTAEETRLSYARMCVEVDAESDFPDSIPIHTPYGIHIQSVQYDWKPSACKTCLDFSHTSEACPKKVQVAQHNYKQEWRPVKPLSKPATQDRDGEEKSEKIPLNTPKLVSRVVITMASALERQRQQFRYQIALKP